MMELREEEGGARPAARQDAGRGDPTQQGGDDGRRGALLPRVVLHEVNPPQQRLGSAPAVSSDVLARVDPPDLPAPSAALC